MNFKTLAVPEPVEPEAYEITLTVPEMAIFREFISHLGIAGIAHVMSLDYTNPNCEDMMKLARKIATEIPRSLGSQRCPQKKA